MLAVGQPAPDLSLTNAVTGDPWQLADLRGAPVLLYVMRAASCRICNAHVRDLIRRRAEFDAAGLRVVIVLPESAREAVAWREGRDVPFDVAVGADEGAGPLALGFTRRLLGGIQQSGTVLIDSAGIVRQTQVATMPTGAYDQRSLQAAIIALATPAHTIVAEPV